MNTTLRSSTVLAMALSRGALAACTVNVSIPDPTHAGGSGAADAGAADMATETSATAPASETADPSASQTADPSASETAETSAPANLVEACAAPHGSAEMLTTATELTSRLAHRWFNCNFGNGIQVYGPGVAFHADGTWNDLALASDGTVTPVLGVDNRGTWNGIVAGSFLEVSFSGDNGTESGMEYIEFEANPRRMRLDTRNATMWFVPIP
jgi:hypothetical protein